jgi:quinol monooxygenase YgiN
MLIILGTVRLPPQNIGPARAAMEAMIAASRAEDGCFDYAYSVDLLDPGLVRVTEVWRDREALDAHFASDHLQAWRAAWPALEISDRQLSLYRADEPSPI